MRRISDHRKSHNGSQNLHNKRELTGPVDPLPSVEESQPDDAATESGFVPGDSAESDGEESIGAEPVAATSTFTAEVWADNWFALYANGELVGEDSVPITTERSFNAETVTFEATYPLTIAIEAKDFKETDSGIEYMGLANQQMGDGSDLEVDNTILLRLTVAS